jgi:hypothetical protein
MPSRRNPSCVSALLWAVHGFPCSFHVDASHHSTYIIIRCTRARKPTGKTSLSSLMQRCSGLESREYGRKGYAALTTRHSSIRKVGTNFADRRRSLSIVRSRTQSTEFVFCNSVIFNHFCSQTPRCNFSSTLYLHSCWCIIQVIHSLQSTKKKLHRLSPRPNYTDRATAACRRNDCQLLRIEGATWSAWRIPTSVFSAL